MEKDTAPAPLPTPFDSAEAPRHHDDATEIGDRIGRDYEARPDAPKHVLAGLAKGVENARGPS